MNLLLGLVVALVVTAITVGAMLAVRGDRASGVFGVLATGFSALLGFMCGAHR